MRKLLGITILMAAALAFLAANFGPTFIKQAFAIGGHCNSCAASFTPSALSSGLSGTGAHGVAKVFAPGQEAQVGGGSASSFAPGHVKP